MKVPKDLRHDIPWGEEAPALTFAYPLVVEIEKELNVSIIENLSGALQSPMYALVQRLANLHFGSEKERVLFFDQLKTTKYYFDEAIKRNPEQMVDCHDTISLVIQESQHQVFNERKYYRDSFNSSEPETKIRRALNYYHELYENAFKHLVTLASYPKIIIANPTLINEISIEEFVNHSPTYRHNHKCDSKEQLLDSEIIVNGFQSKCLLNGYNNDIRNAIAHKHIYFDYPDKEEVTLKNIHNGKVLWSHKFTYNEIRNIIANFEKTIEALTISLYLTSINHVKIFQTYSKTSLQKPSATHIRDTITMTFRDFGFATLQIEPKEDFSSVYLKVQVRLFATSKTIGPSITQMNLKGQTVRMINKAKDISIDVNQNLIGLLQRCFDIFTWFSQLEIDVLDENGIYQQTVFSSNPKETINKINSFKLYEEVLDYVKSIKLFRINEEKSQWELRLI